MSVSTESGYELLSTACGAVARERGVLRLTGAGAAEFLQGQLTNDIEALRPGDGVYALLLTHKGRIRADMRVLRDEQGILIDCEPIAREIVARMITTYSLGREVELRDVTEETAVVSVIGPAAAEAVGTGIPIEENAHAEAALGGLAIRTDVGIDLLVARADAARLAAKLGIEEVGGDAAEVIRVERGRPRLGIDMGGETIPQEAGLNDRAVSFTKGCYVGQETVARLHYKGRPNRHLRGLTLTREAATGEEVRSAGKLVARVGSTALSPALGPIALALVRRELGPGDAVSVDAAAAAARVVALPFVPPA